MSKSDIHCLSKLLGKYKGDLKSPKDFLQRTSPVETASVLLDMFSMMTFAVICWSPSVLGRGGHSNFYSKRGRSLERGTHWREGPH